MDLSDSAVSEEMKENIALEVLVELRKYCDIEDIGEFDVSVEDIIDLSCGTVNHIIRVLEKLIRFLPITRFSDEEMELIRERTEAILAAA
jgi:hypothetical protein